MKKIVRKKVSDACVNMCVLVIRVMHFVNSLSNVSQAHCIRFLRSSPYSSPSRAAREEWRGYR